MKSAWTWGLVGGLLWAGGLARAESCEKYCREETRQCVAICEEHAGGGTAKCVKACEQEEKTCVKECKEDEADAR
ncbi:MAG TPA: hypothetical protein VFZ09_24215 [Archangium sp.]|uniref:hypothetical protein n=1 Tax=Archangium sp. TaxID=1872627 RepID=UPI002E3642F3|nr:hypothetical protein [Archangium sp.]HEX5749355.1 hypothetical protein [Archangium sp.]